MERKALIFGAILLILHGCIYSSYEDIMPYSKATQCDTSGTISYNMQIVPLMTNQCGSGDNACHSHTSIIPLASYTEVKNYAASGILYSSIIWDKPISPMPKGSTIKIDTCFVKKMKKWIDQGMQDN